MGKAKRKSRKKRGALVHTHLERVSRRLLEKHFDIVKNLIGRNAGVYALYRKSRLRYIGLTTKLSGRLKDHLKGRHGTKWDNFSIYLTINNQHLKEIEALILRIADPPANKQSGKLAGSRDMWRSIKGAVRQKAVEQIKDLGRKSYFDEEDLDEENGQDSALAKLLPRGAKLKGTLKKKVFRASVTRNGKIRFKGNVYSSLSVAAIAAIGRPTNGWWFWQVERPKGHWVRLTEIRRAGTPVIP